MRTTGGDEVGHRVAWDVDAYVDRVRAKCFVCALLAGDDGYEHHVVHRDETAVVFLAKYPSLWGHVLVAPSAHREQVVGDFSEDEYAELQRLIHRVGRALTSVIETERLYVTSLGSQQGNTHVHWHVLPLPPGVPYEDQQMAVFDTEKGWLHCDDAEMARLAADLRRALGRRRRTGRLTSHPHRRDPWSCPRCPSACRSRRGRPSPGTWSPRSSAGSG